MRKAARTVKPNARTGERHTWKDRERRRKEERQRMAAEALIVEDAYQRGYADAIADMRKKKEQRRQREQAKKARRWYFIKQKAYGLAMLAVTVLAVWATEGDITIAVITVPLAEAIYNNWDMAAARGTTARKNDSIYIAAIVRPE